MIKKIDTKIACSLLLFGTLLLPPMQTTANAFGTSMPSGSAGETADATVSGKVLETMDAAGYTYINVETASGKNWIAVPASKVKVGDEISYYNGMVMSNFSSKTLNRTFESIVFSPGLVGQGGATGAVAAPNDATHANIGSGGDSFENAVQAEAGMQAQLPADVGSGGSLAAMAPQDEIKVAKAEGENGYTVEEVFTKREELNGKTVRVHGKVVKFSPNIMGRNWIHIQDGTGDAMKNTHDLVVTSNESAEKGKAVTIEGKAAANRDFGAGYSYEVIVEEAKIVK